jgi:hypothetical protein
MIKQYVLKNPHEESQIRLTSKNEYDLIYTEKLESQTHVQKYSVWDDELNTINVEFFKDCS